MGPSDILFIIGALIAILVGIAGARNYCQTHGISVMRQLCAGAYIFAFLGLFLNWMGFSASNCIAIFCTSLGGASGNVNAFGIAGGINPTLQNMISQAVLNRNTSAEEIQVIVSGLGNQSVIIILSSVVGLTAVLFTLLPQTMAGSKPNNESLFRTIALLITVIASIVGIISTIGLISSINTLIQNYQDSSISWSLSIGPYLTIISLGIGAVCRLVDRSTAVSPTTSTKLTTPVTPQEI